MTKSDRWEITDRITKTYAVKFSKEVDREEAEHLYRMEDCRVESEWYEDAGVILWVIPV